MIAGNDAQGWLMRTSNVRSSTTTTCWISFSVMDDKPASRESKFAFAASAFKGLPSWNLMLGRNLNVHLDARSDGVIDSARYGCGTPSASNLVSDSSMVEATR